VILFFLVVMLEIGFNAAAGAAAAVTGAHVNALSNSVTATTTYDLQHVLRLGALAGVMKSGIMSMVAFAREFGGATLGVWMILLVVSSGFGVSLLVTSAISNLVYGTGERRHVKITEKDY